MANLQPYRYIFIVDPELSYCMRWHLASFDCIRFFVYNWQHRSRKYRWAGRSEYVDCIDQIEWHLAKCALKQCWNIDRSKLCAPQYRLPNIERKQNTFASGSFYLKLNYNELKRQLNFDSKLFYLIAFRIHKTENICEWEKQKPT